MGPIEILFLTVIAIFGVIGIVRGLQRELGVTTMLLVALSIITLSETFLEPRLSKALGFDPNAANVMTTQAIIYTTILFVITFIAYQGETLTFPGGGPSPILALLVGLINGYFFAGTIWYYWNRAGWPAGLVVPPFDQFYDAMLRILPPAILPWWFFVSMLILMLLLRVLK
jgi:hypothetical protein